MPTSSISDFIPPDTIDCMMPQELQTKLRLADAMLKKCFAHLGEEIRRKHLNESGHDGTQALSLEIARTLDSIWSK